MTMQRFTEKSQEALVAAQRLAEDSHHAEVDALHLLASLTEQQGGVFPLVIRSAGADSALVANQVRRELERLPKAYGSTEAADSRGLRDVLRAAEDEASRLKDDYVSTEHLLLAIGESKGPAADIMTTLDLGRDKLLSALTQIRGSQRVTDATPEATYDALSKYGRDLTDLAREGKVDPVIGRDEEIRRVIQVLGRRTKNNPVLIGEPGVGKTAIVEGLAHRIVRGDVPEGLKDRRVWALDLGALVAGAKYRGEYADFVTNVFPMRVRGVKHRAGTCCEERRLRGGRGARKCRLRE